MAHVVQIGFFLDPQARSPARILEDWWPLVDAAEIAAQAGLQVSVIQPCVASETVTYTYDAQGRLIETAHSGGPNANLDIRYGYDLRGNRTTQTISGSKNNGQQVVVLPLNGFTIIPINP